MSIRLVLLADVGVLPEDRSITGKLQESCTRK